MTAENSASRFSFEQMHLLDGAFVSPIVGSNAIVRKVHPTVDPDDLRRIVEIENSPDKRRWFENVPVERPPMTEEDALREVLDRENHIVLAVAGLSTRKDIHEAHEDGKLQGVLYFNQESEFRMRQLQEQRLIPQAQGLILEASYAKWPPAPGGQVSDALRIACKKILDQAASVGEEVVINAYIMNDDRGTNVASVRVLLSAGFEEKGNVKYDETGQYNDRLFVLNPEKLEETITSRQTP